MTFEPDLALAEQLFARLHQASFDGVGVTREAYGQGEQIGHDMVRDAALALGMVVSRDAAGNLYATIPGLDPAARKIVMGSHLDSVPQGGDYDGPVGVFSALAVASGMVRAGLRPRCDVVVMVIRAEEAGAWFPFSFPGSRAALGTLPAEALEVKRRDTGRTLAVHMREAGFDPAAVLGDPPALPPGSVGAFVEMHIEQGPVLDTRETPLALVRGIPGARRYRTGRVVGEYNHSGATPREFRRDAALALAELVVAVDRAWVTLAAQGHELVATFCEMATTDAAGFTKIAGEARFALDLRSLSHATLDAVEDKLTKAIGDIEAARGVRFELGERGVGEPVLLDAALQAELAACADALHVPHLTMASGGGHDAGAFAAAGVASAMLFVRNQNGSHNPHEAMRMEDFAQACRVLAAWVALRAEPS